MSKKVYLLIVSTVIVAFVISGCGGGSSQTQQNPSSAVQSETAGASEQISSNTTTASNTAADTTQATESPIDNSNEKPVAPEKNPPGDIPDSQVFIKYISATGNYELQVPEGWARSENGTDVKYVDKLDGIQVKISTANDSFTIDNIKKDQVAALEKTGRAVKIKSTEEIKLTGGQAVLVKYDSNSEPDPVTNKQVRLENESIFFNNNGKLAEIVLWAPLGADNIDQWNLISNSFKWR